MTISPWTQQSEIPPEKEECFQLSVANVEEYIKFLLKKLELQEKFETTPLNELGKMVAIDLITLAFDPQKDTVLYNEEIPVGYVRTTVEGEGSFREFLIDGINTWKK